MGEGNQDEGSLREALAFAGRIISTIREPFVVLGDDLRVELANRAFYRTFGVEPGEIRGLRFFELGDGQWDIPELRRLLDRLAGEDADFEDYEVRHDFSGLGPRVMLLNARRLIQDGGRILLAIEDVTERKDSERALAESRGRTAESARFLAGTLDALTSHIAVLDDRGVILQVNDAWRRFAAENGLTDEDQSVGRNYLDTCVPEGEGYVEDDPVNDGIRSVIQGRASHFTCEYPCHSPTERRWFVMRVSRFAGPGPTRVVVSHDNITERVLAEEALRESERRFRFLSELDEATRHLRDPGRVMEAASRLLGEHLGASRCVYAEVKSDGDQFSIRHDYVAGGMASSVGDYRLGLFGSKTVAAMRGGQTLVVPDVPGALAPDDGAATFGAIGVTAFVCCPLVKEGRLTAMMAVHQDHPRDWSGEEVALVEAVAERSWAYIERARADRDLLANEARFRALADNISQFAWMTDAQGSAFWYNRRWFQYTGTSLDEVLGNGWASLVHPDHVGGIAERFDQALVQGQPWEDTVPLRGKDGTYRWFLSRALPIRDESGAIRLWFGTNTDITERRDAEQERERLLDAAQAARREAEAANRMKDDFLATLSHELRTPLNAILGWAKILRSQDVDPEDLEEGLAAIERNASSQAQIIGDLLDISRIVSGNFKLEVQRVAIREVIEAAVAAVAPMASAKGIRVHKILDSLAGPVSGDPVRLQQVVWNLLSNAVKFTPRGGRVQVLLERVNSHLEISVVDSGLGIKPEFLPHVFDRFRQADASTTRRHGGLGLGLAIVKQLVEMHGGDVRAKSPGEGQGSTFTVSLPIAVVHPEHPSPTPPPRPMEVDGAAEPWERRALAGVRVLIVDDEPDARQLIRRALVGSMAEVATASSAAEAIDLVARFRPEVLVSDIGMPDRDGYDLIRRVRAEHSSHDLPAAALTAFARAEDRRRALLAGFQTHLSKPIDPAELVAVVASLAGRTGLD